MNPFDWQGPQFLVFYAILTAAFAGFLWVTRHRGEKTLAVAAPELTDPYLVAYLRAGPAEVWRLATVRLIDSEFMQVDGDTVTMFPTAQSSEALNQVERETLEWFRKPQTAASLIGKSRSERMEAVVAPYKARLVELGLLPGENARTARLMRYATVVGILAVVALIKVMLALERGHKNILFLVFSAIMAAVALYRVGTPPHTIRGEAIMADLEKLFSRLRQPGLLQSGKSSAEIVWMAAVYGVSALSVPQFAKLFPVPRTSGSACGTSCGSGCGGSCGGGCGGCGS